MVRVTFVCLGNICRSPMAELIFKDIIARENLDDRFVVSSCATSSYEVGNPVYPPAARTLKAHGITGEHRARRITRADLAENDFVLVMDSQNLADVLSLAGEEYCGKVYKLCSFTSVPRDVSDPYYTRDFERAFADITDGCRAFLGWLKANNYLNQ